jgi:hypothetical protein
MRLLGREPELKEPPPDRVEQARVRRRVAPARAADRVLVDTTPSRPATASWISELLPDPATTRTGLSLLQTSGAAW